MTFNFGEYNVPWVDQFLYSPHQRTLLGTSANQKRHYLKSYNKCMYTFQCTPCREGTGWMAKIMTRFGKYNLQ
jgi:hypothetical protein